ncbi:MAG: LacI family transcriptional regulator [Ignavibacteriae bacterium]|nr:MAG: LacI family transcriptional regulator [Ignavibacteriota bacterium]
MANQPDKIVVTAPYFGSSFQIAILDHFKKLLNPENLSFRSSTGELDKQTDSLKKILGENKPTVLIAISMSPSPEIVTMYKTNHVPIILLDEEARGTSTIATDNHKGGLIAAEHLISKGKKKIAIVNGRAQAEGKWSGNYCARLRLEGFKEALRHNGLSIPPGCSLEVPNYSREDGIGAMPKLLDAGADAVFCAAADNTALGLLSVAKERKIRVPEDMAIIGFDDLPVAQLSTPGLTTIRQPMKEMVEAAFKMATTQQEEILKNPKKILFEPKLVIRQSA